MNQGTHISMTARAASFSTDAKWRAMIDPKVLATAAAAPDQVLAIKVEGVGHHLLGRNLASLTHFCHALPGDGGLRGEGYRWRHDKSVLGINLPNRDVEPTPDGWSKLFPCLLDEDLIDEPLHELVEDLRGKATLAADEITYPTAATMLDWAYRRFLWTTKRDVPREMSYEIRTARLSALVGMMCHWVQDLHVPYHGNCALLGGHSEFEGAQGERWQVLASDLKRMEALAVEAHTSGPVGNPKDFALRCARTFYRSPRSLCLFRLWPPRWRKLADETVRAGFIATVRLLDRLRGGGRS